MKQETIKLLRLSCLMFFAGCMVLLLIAVFYSLVLNSQTSLYLTTHLPADKENALQTLGVVNRLGNLLWYIFGGIIIGLIGSLVFDLLLSGEDYK